MKEGTPGANAPDRHGSGPKEPVRGRHLQVLPFLGRRNVKNRGASAVAVRRSSTGEDMSESCAYTPLQPALQAMRSDLLFVLSRPHLIMLRTNGRCWSMAANRQPLSRLPLELFGLEKCRTARNLFQRKRTQWLTFSKYVCSAPCAYKTITAITHPQLQTNRSLPLRSRRCKGAWAQRQDKRPPDAYQSGGSRTGHS